MTDSAGTASSQYMRANVIRLRRREMLAAGMLLVTLTACLAFLPARYRLHIGSIGGMHQAAHIAVFAAMGFLIFRGTRSYRAHTISAILLVLLAVGTELGEHLLFRSTLEYDDIVADFAGILIGILGALAVRRNRTRRYRPTRQW